MKNTALKTLHIKLENVLITRHDMAELIQEADEVKGFFAVT